MKLLLDTQVIIWAAFWPELLPTQSLHLISDVDNEIYFSPASLWEVAIKSAQNRSDFRVEAKTLRTKLLERGYQEIAINGLHTTAVSDLPMLHKDPFDRLLLAQAKIEGISLITSDATLSKYPAPVIMVHKSS